MTVSLDARTPSASVHALSGSTPPGATMQPFGITTAAVHEMPDAFTPLGTAAADVVAGLAAGRLAATHPDAEVIDLAERVKGLAERELRLVLRVVAIEDAVMMAMPPRPERTEGILRMMSDHSVDDDGTRVLTIREPAGWAAETRANREAHEAALAARERFEEEEGARRGLPLLNKLRDRAVSRLERWGLQLAATKPATQAGLKAKAAASRAVTEDGVLPDDWRQRLAVSVSDDALRIIGAEADARAEQDRQADGELLALGRAWEASAARCDATTEAYDEATDRFSALTFPVPEALFWTEQDHRRAKPYGSEHVATGRRWFGEGSSIEALRQGYPKELPEERRREIIEAYERWQGTKLAAGETSGYVAAREADQEAGLENRALRRTILAMPAHTMDGILLKARVARWCFMDDEDEIARHLAFEAKDSRSAGETMAFSILLDLARMVSAEPAAIPAPAAASNLRPVPLPADLSALRLGADAAGDVREWYRSWLYAELRLLNLELDGSAEGSRIRQDNPGAAFHYPPEVSWTDVPKPSTRAAAVLDLFGILPRHDGTGDLARVA